MNRKKKQYKRRWTTHLILKSCSDEWINSNKFELNILSIEGNPLIVLQFFHFQFVVLQWVNHWHSKSLPSSSSFLLTTSSIMVYSLGGSFSPTLWCSTFFTLNTPASFSTHLANESTKALLPEGVGLQVNYSVISSINRYSSTHLSPSLLTVAERNSLEKRWREAVRTSLALFLACTAETRTAWRPTAEGYWNHYCNQGRGEDSSLTSLIGLDGSWEYAVEEALNTSRRSLLLGEATRAPPE